MNSTQLVSRNHLTGGALGGFQDQVAELLYNAIHSEDDMISPVGESDVKVVQAFHVIDMARRLDQWQNYYDIVGIQFYPNEMFAYPVLGYMIGETVYSVKRALDVLGLEKPVWVLENMYPVNNEQFLEGLEEANPDTMQDFSQNIKYRSTKRQKQFVKEAIQTSAKYGADVYNYFRLITSFYHNPNQGAGATYSSVNMYGGLIRRDGVNQTLTQLPAFDTYHDEFDANSPLDWVTLKTMYLDTEDLDGTLSIDDVVSGIASGETRRLNETRQYTARTDNEWLNKPSNGDAVKHHKWNNDFAEFKLKHNFTPNDVQSKTQKAKYNDQKIAYFSVDVPGALDDDFTHLIKIRDPWYVTSSKTQPNTFIALEDTNVYSVFLDQNEQFQPDKPIYSLKAPNLFATVDGIYEFIGWGGTNVSFANSSNRETEVVFQASGATATATYELASDRDYGVVLSAGDELIIPAGANFTCANYFTLYVEGELIIAGTKNEPVSLVTHFETYSPDITAFIEVKDGGKLYGSGLQITGDPGCCLSPPLIKAQPGSIVKISHSTFTTNGTGIMAEDAYVELSRCVISPIGTLTDFTNGIDITLNDHTHNSFSPTNNLFNQVLLENCSILGMDKGIDIQININSSGYWKGLYIHNSIMTENNTGIKGEGYLSSNVELDYVNISNLTNYDIDENIINSHIQTTNPLLDNNHYPTTNSPVIDWGDPSSPFDPDGTQIDLGAYYKHQPPSIPTNFKIKGLAGNSPRLTFNSNEDYVHTWHILRKLGNEQEFSVLAVVYETQYIDNTVTIAADKKFSQDACYKVIAVDNFGFESNPTNSRCKAVVGNQDKLLNVPMEYALHHAFSNPFNPETTIKYDLPEQSKVHLNIFDLLGRKINTLKNNTEDAGFYSIKWNGRDEHGNPLSSGMYIIHISARSLESEEMFTKSQKVVLLK